MFVDLEWRATEKSEFCPIPWDVYPQAVVNMMDVLAARDGYTARHSEDTGIWAGIIAKRLGCSAIEAQTICLAALLHDIGKIKIPDSILLKPGALTEQEWQVIHKHPEIGANLILSLTGMESVANLVRAHHERFDGRGYPDRLCGNHIPIGARIIAVLDAYSAMTDQRVYKAAYSHEFAMAELCRNAGTQFDPQIVDIFLFLCETANDKIM